MRDDVPFWRMPDIQALTRRVLERRWTKAICKFLRKFTMASAAPVLAEETVVAHASVPPAPAEPSKRAMSRLAAVRVLKAGIKNIGEKIETTKDELERKRLIDIRDKYIREHKRIRREIMTEEYI